MKQLLENLKNEALNTFNNVISNTDNIIVIKSAWGLTQKIINKNFIEYKNKIITKDTMEEWKALFYETNNKIEVIKKIKEYTELGLRECKYFFDFILFDKPMI